MGVIQHDNITVTHFINPFKTSNSFLVEIAGQCGVWLFDIGDSEALFSAIASCKINGLFLTHCHFDHIKGIKRLISKHPECVIYGSKKCLEWICDDRRNLSFYYERPIHFVPQNCIPISERDYVELFNSISVQIIETPGHNEDCLTYKFKNFLVTGDSYIPNVPPVTKLKGGNKEHYSVNEKRIKELIDDNTYLLPGHGPVYRGNVIIQ